jgi:hypothetical protein
MFFLCPAYPCLPAWQPCLSDRQPVIPEIRQAGPGRPFGPFILSPLELHAALLHALLYNWMTLVPL